MTTASPPFRAEPKRVDPKHLIASRRLIASAEENTKKILTRVQKELIPTKDLVKLVCAHPDERVVVDAIATWRRRLNPEDRWRLCLRGVRTNKTERIFWNPILDAMAQYDCWAPPEWKGPRGNRWPSRLRQENYLKPLVNWIKKQTDPSAIELLLEFKSKVVRSAIAQNARIMTKEWAQQLPLPNLAANPHLPDDLVEWVAQQAVELVLEPPPQTTWLTPQFMDVDLGAYGVTTIQQLVHANRRIPIHLIDRMIDRMNGSASWACLTSITDLGKQISPAQLERALGTAQKSHELALLVQHAAGTDEFKCRVFEKAVATGIELDPLRSSLIRAHPQALAHPKILEYVLGTTSAETLNDAMIAVAKANEDLFRTVLRRFIACAPQDIAKIVNNTARGFLMCKKWRERACKEHMDEIIEGVIRSNDVQAMRELTWYDGAVRDPRLHAALAEHPQANLDTLRHLVSFARNDALRQAWRRIGLLLSSPKEKALNKIKELKDLWSSLERLNEEGVNDLRAEDFAPLLQAEDPELRMETIRLLAHLQGATETRPTPAQPKPLQSRRGQHTKA